MVGVGEGGWQSQQNKDRPTDHKNSFSDHTHTSWNMLNKSDKSAYVKVKIHTWRVSVNDTRFTLSYRNSLDTGAATCLACLQLRVLQEEDSCGLALFIINVQVHHWTLRCWRRDHVISYKMMLDKRGWEHQQRLMARKMHPPAGFEGKWFHTDSPYNAASPVVSPQEL